ncbi:hypothetical protein EMIT051CA3_60376 [Pseudomonas chlororaphis]
MRPSVLRGRTAWELCRWRYIDIATLFFVEANYDIATAFQHIYSFSTISLVLIDNYIFRF